MTGKYFIRIIQLNIYDSIARICYPDGDYLCEVSCNLGMNITAPEIAKKICDLLNKEQENEPPTPLP